MNNYSNFHPDEVPYLFCEKCGKYIEDMFIFAEATEYEKEVAKCQECIYELAGVSKEVII